MDTTTDTTPANNTTSGGECGPDCVYIAGACRCYHGEAATSSPAWMGQVASPF